MWFCPIFLIFIFYIVFYFLFFFAKYFVQRCKLVSLCCVGTEAGLVLSSIIPWSIVQDKSCIFFWQVNFTLNFYLLKFLIGSILGEHFDIKTFFRGAVCWPLLSTTEFKTTNIVKLCVFSINLLLKFSWIIPGVAVVSFTVSAIKNMITK